MANSAFGHEPSFTTPGSTTDNAVIRWDGTSGDGQLNSGIIIDDSNVITGITSLTVDNLNVNGNTIISTDSNGSITLTPHGTGSVVISKVDLNAGDITGVTISGGLTWSAAQNLNSQALTNVNIDSGDISAATVSGGLTWSSAQNLNSQALTNVNIDSGDISAGTVSGSLTWSAAQTFGAVTATQVDITAAGDLRLQDSTGGQYVALEAAGTTTSHTLTLPAAQGGASTVLTNDGSGGLTWTAASGGIASVAADTSPQLGGNLDVVTHILTSASNYNVRIQPAGNGDIVMAPNGVTIGTGGSATKAPVQILCGPIISHRANCLELVGPTGNGLNEPASNGTSDSGGGGQLSITSSTLVTSGNTYGQSLGGRIVFGGKYHSGGYDTPFASIAGLKESNSQNGNADTAGYLSLYTREAADPWGMIERMKISSGGEVTVKENASMPSVTQGIAKGFVRFGSTANVIGTSYNVSAVSVSSSLFTISWSDDFTDGNYTVVGVTASGAARHGVLHAASAGSCEWLAFNSSGTEIGGDACIVAYGIRET